MTVAMLGVDFPPLTRTSVVPATFNLTASIPLTGTAYVSALDADTAVPSPTTPWVTATWDAAQTTTTEGDTTWYHRSFTILLAGDSTPPRNDQVTMTPGEWSMWVRLDVPPARIERRFDLVTVLP